jgi:uncharacterized protein (DUF169 family)
MDSLIFDRLPRFLQLLGLTEDPLGIFFTDQEPKTGFSPKPMDPPTREKEIENSIDWQTIFSQFSCVMGNIWRARKKNVPAYFSSRHFGCPGGAFWLGFLKPQTETIIHYVSSGIPGYMEGEHYCDSPDELRRIFGYIDPRPALNQFCVIKSIRLFEAGEEPELIVFFSRPESLCGLHQLAAFVTHDPEVVVSPWSAACGSLVAWPFHYQSKGLTRAVIGGWDPSARKFFNPDELSFTVPTDMFLKMLKLYEKSFLSGKTWKTVGKKIDLSHKVWERKTKKNKSDTKKPIETIPEDQ